MGIGLGVLFQFRFIVHAWFGELKAACLFVGVGDDVSYTIDSGQIASDRGGTTTSDHIGNFEADKHDRLPHCI